MPDPTKILVTIQRATELFRSTPGRKGSVMTLDGAEEVLVVGDLHGNIPAFRQVLKLADLGNHPRRHLVLQELVHGPHSYPDDGGDRSHQLVDLVCALKCQTPDRVHVILGNHELSELTGRSIAKGGVPLNALYLQGIKTAYGSMGDAIYQSHLQLFSSLPLLVRLPNRVLLCHTVPDPLDLDRLDLSVLDLDLWPPESMTRGGTVYALTWGRNIEPENVDRFAELIDADFFVTGHQPCDDGFRKANHRQVIIDGTDPYPAACLIKVNEPASVEALLNGVRLL